MKDWKKLIEEADWSIENGAKLSKAIAEDPCGYEEFMTRKKGQEEDDFEPGSDMHVWATTRFF